MQKRIIFHLSIMLIIGMPLFGMQEGEFQGTVGMHEGIPLTMNRDLQEQWNCCDACWQNTEDPCRNCDDSFSGVAKCLFFTCLFTAYGCFCYGEPPAGGM